MHQKTKCARQFLLVLFYQNRLNIVKNLITNYKIFTPMKTILLTLTLMLTTLASFAMNTTTPTDGEKDATSEPINKMVSGLNHATSDLLLEYMTSRDFDSNETKVLEVKFNFYSGIISDNCNSSLCNKISELGGLLDEFKQDLSSSKGKRADVTDKGMKILQLADKINILLKSRN